MKMSKVTLQARLRTEFERGRADGYNSGYAAGREEGRKAVLQSHATKELDLRCQMVTAMAHALQALASVAVT